MEIRARTKAGALKVRVGDYRFTPDVRENDTHVEVALSYCLDKLRNRVEAIDSLPEGVVICRFWGLVLSIFSSSLIDILVLSIFSEGAWFTYFDANS